MGFYIYGADQSEKQHEFHNWDKFSYDELKVFQRTLLRQIRKQAEDRVLRDVKGFWQTFAAYLEVPKMERHDPLWDFMQELACGSATASAKICSKLSSHLELLTRDWTNQYLQSSKAIADAFVQRMRECAEARVDFYAG